jgi:hypothetical protein
MIHKANSSIILIDDLVKYLDAVFIFEKAKTEAGILSKSFGNFKKGKLHGFGHQEHNNISGKIVSSEKYTGFFKDGKYHGEGILETFCDGIYSFRDEGIFDDGEFIDD